MTNRLRLIQQYNKNINYLILSVTAIIVLAMLIITLAIVEKNTQVVYDNYLLL